MVVYLACERDVYFVAVEASYADSAVSLMYRTYPRVLTRVAIVRSTSVGVPVEKYARVSTTGILLKDVCSQRPWLSNPQDFYARGVIGHHHIYV